MWHQRLVLCWVAAGEYVVATPDWDIFIEQLDAGNPDFEGLRYGDAAGTLPVGLAAQPMYAFALRPSGADLAGLLFEGAAHARTERLARGLVGAIGGGPPAAGGALAPVVVPVPPAVLPPALPGAAPIVAIRRVAGVGGIWVLDEPLDGFSLGQEVVFPPGGLDFGGRSFVRVGEALVGITRVQAGVVLDDWIAHRMGSFLKVDGRCFNVGSSEEGLSLSRADALMPVGPTQLLPLKGPTTVGDSIKSIMLRTNGGFMTSHDRWMIEAKMDLTNRSRYEHKVLSRALDLAYGWDGINIKSSRAFEYINRRRQLLEEAHREDPSRPNFECAHLYMGEEDESSGVHLSSALRAHVASELSKEAAILKERRKAQEAKEARVHRPKAKGAAVDK
jgi:hypothetical protein